MVDRSSEADEPLLVTDAQEIARIEAENTLRQFDAAMVELGKWIGNPQYKLRSSPILKFNRVALERLSKYAGVFRPSDIKITGSGHVPPSAEKVPELLEEFCDYISENWNEKSAIYLSSYALWRLNWIHPFVDGNGRTARIVSYLILCAKLGYRLPGTTTIPEQIALNKKPYYAALEDADQYEKSGEINVSALQNLMDSHLATQLVEVHNRANGDGSENRSAVATYPDTLIESYSNKGSGWSTNIFHIFGHIEKHPVLYGGAFTLIAALVAAVLS
jgi:fido (protein-threonine AMPylation protein)